MSHYGPGPMIKAAAISSDLFDVILLNDEIDLSIAPPERVDLAYTQRQIAHAFAASLAVWEEGYTRRDILSIADGLSQTRTIDAQGQLVFKHIRARFKHLRFAFAMFDESHRYPLYLDLVTSMMGNLQDAFKNGVGGKVRRDALLLKLVCAALPYRLLSFANQRYQPSDTVSFSAYISAGAQKIRSALDKGDLTAHEFHEVRKIISRNRAAFATLCVVEPNENNRHTARFLATINGLMGNYHDELIARKLAGTLNYARDREPLHDDVRTRLEALSARMIEGGKL